MSQGEGPELGPESADRPVVLRGEVVSGVLVRRLVKEGLVQLL